MAITEYYVSAAGGGAHDGTSEANAWTLSEAITANNALGAGGAAGRRYNIKGAHTARGADDTISVGGTATSPAIWRGYNSTIGDLDTGTRDAYGVLDTTNFPDLGYNSTFRLIVSGSHIVIANIDIAGARSGNVVTPTGASVHLYGCRISNTSTNASAIGISMASTNSRVVNCDVSTGASGGTTAIDCTAVVAIVGCRVTAPGCTGIRLNTSNTILTVVGCTVFGCVDGIAASNATAGLALFGNTIYGCSGDGVDIISTSSVVTHQIVGNHITDNGGYGVNVNGGTSGAFAAIIGNRFRDNTSGNVDGFADWTTGTKFREITTDAGGASTDYVDAATNKDFRLISTAAGYRQGFAYNANVGACGDNVSGGGGGAMVIGG